MILQYSARVFNEIVKDFDEVSHLKFHPKPGKSDEFESGLIMEEPGTEDGMERVLGAFGNLFLKFGVEKHATLALSHHHFKLASDEKKIACPLGNNTIGIKPIACTKTSDTMAHIFLPMMDDKGEVALAPLEFLSTSCLTSLQIKALEADQKAICDPKFVKEFLGIAAQFGVEHVFGIVLSSSRHMLDYNPDTHIAVEVPGDSPRTLLVKVLPKLGLELEKEGHSTTVYWQFCREGGIIKCCQKCNPLRICIHP